MASISSNNEYISVSCGLKTYVVHMSNCKLFCVDHKDIPSMESNKTSGVSKSSGGSEDIGVGLLCSDFSPQGNLLAFCTFAKLLCIVDIGITGISFKKVYQLARGASKVRFTPSGKNIVVADKSGDVYLFDPLGTSDTGSLILGHLSMLLDVLVTPDEQFIITCDRDEKIRVSSFPNAYNITAYCLGHCEFVSSILLLPSNKSYLISTSGDGTIRIWDYKIGKEVGVCNMKSYLVKTESQEADDLDVAAITDAAALAIDNSTSIVCVTIEYFNMFLVIKCKCEEGEVQFSLDQKLSLDESSPWKLTVTSNILWMVLNEKNKVRLRPLKFDECLQTFDDDLPKQVSEIITIINSKLMNEDSKNIVNLLFKRKFDNVQEYLNKKEARMMLLEHCNKKPKK